MLLRFSKEIYSREALLKTAFCFTDTVYIHMQQDTYDWIVDWFPKNETSSIDSRAFENELIAQSLREEVSTQTQDLRKLILARAMASTLIEEDSAMENHVMPESNPEQILTGWFKLHHE